MFREYNFFWTTMELCDWDQEGDDDKVLKPVIEYLSKQEDCNGLRSESDWLA